MGERAAVYIHIPFCESLCTYCGCNTRITRNHKVALPYIDVVIKEWNLYLDGLKREKIPLGELHLGGGTPTFLSPHELSYLLSGILARARTLSDAEFSVEADPRVTRIEHLEVLKKFGFTRLSLGIQDFDPQVQETVHRTQTEAEVKEVTDNARRLGFNSINYDLIYGLPFQTLSSIEQTIEVVKRLRPDRIAFYSYAHVPWIKPAHRRFTEADLPSGDQKRALYELGRKRLEEVGYREIGMDHFALESDSLWKATQEGTLHRNFMGYTSRQVAPQIGLGVSAIGDSWYVFAQNEKIVETYQKRVQAGELPLLRGHVLSPEDQVIRRHVLNLMTRLQTDTHAPGLTDPFLDTVPERLTELTRDGLLEISEGKFRITEKGKPFLRNTCMAFDARLVRQQPKTQVFSQTI